MYFFLIKCCYMMFIYLWWFDEQMLSFVLCLTSFAICFCILKFTQTYIHIFVHTPTNMQTQHINVNTQTYKQTKNKSFSFNFFWVGNSFRLLRCEMYFVSLRFLYIFSLFVAWRKIKYMWSYFCFVFPLADSFVSIYFIFFCV